ncbi:alpha/beta hydrolase [Microbacterium sp. C7(2022)]|uniref:alpha/beta hydrolase n=1 Tax=Microbacterium sp. C7(2022) TaxID=2992759 RepID=UPI00237C239E|nr:alpha/beta hydrolase [Microbacterium sp. C7(2022)]MDE0545173.1 alpha/beta hydrolase family protein [Microbacterium sp. C7(2022)]
MSLPGLGDVPGEGDADSIRTIAGLFRRRGAAERERNRAALNGLRSLSPVTALSVDALRPDLTAFAHRFLDVALAAEDAGEILDDYAAAVEDLQYRASRLRAQAEEDYSSIWTQRTAALNAASDFAVGWALDWDDVLPSWLYLDDRGYLDRWQAAIDDYRLTAARYNALRAERDDVDSATAGRLLAIDLVNRITRDGVVDGAGVFASTALWVGDTDEVTADQIAALADPELVREVWDSLDRARRDTLIEESPEVIGNLDGIPIADRITANRINIADAIVDHEGEIERLQDAREAALIGAGRGRTAIERRFDDLIAQEQQMIDYYDGLLTQKVAWQDESGVRQEDVGARVVVFDPSRQAIATYHGALDPETGGIPDWVTSVAISVPGTGAQLTGFSDNRAAELYAAAGGDSAIFQWAGGEFPQTIPGAMDTSYAHDLAPRLRDFAAGVSVPDSAALTVMGHSYGGATVGLAEEAGLRADRVLYVAAAGMGDGVSGVDDFPHTSDVPHYAMMSRNDLVVGLIQGSEGDLHALHGQSSLRADGVTRLETGVIDGDDPNSIDIEDFNVSGNGTPSAIDSHSSLYTPGSTAFNNMVAVITGGEAELFAPDEVLIVGGRAVTIDGIDRDDYTPAYTKVGG